MNFLSSAIDEPALPCLSNFAISPFHALSLSSLLFFYKGVLVLLLSRSSIVYRVPSHGL
ncbi:uncharacterized protein BDV17DRAFT_255356 [Aspergillus undulatus]|uniref:uncharacterized protein n=1 Tax=Aspergillus undulatus TaxID=1810928 RepID=UPI003CCE43D7